MSKLKKKTQIAKLKSIHKVIKLMTFFSNSLILLMSKSQLNAKLEHNFFQIQWELMRKNKKYNNKLISTNHKHKANNGNKRNKLQ